MAKHRLQQPNRGMKSARGALIAGSITLGAMGMAAAPAMAAPITVPGVGTFDIPGVTEGQIPNELKPQSFLPQAAAPQAKPVGQIAADAAVSKIGSPYVYGAAGPDAFDCSGLVYWSHQQAGQNIPRDSYGQLGGGTSVSAADAQPGDVVIYNGGGHAGIYIGGGQVVHSSTEGVPVAKMGLNDQSVLDIRRY
ncbi:C40 family peptidase [Williamsia sp. 1135]|uniref:C40 family peptidase n=1 Tax=Williamsia sp. 1135 TaxID=1889262 RepID=UPI000A0F7720|nr:C40 family peptidase [Williamsia sp. 1135]ORM33662.1 hydrolase [Williamsia sp. 1135]